MTDLDNALEDDDGKILFADESSDEDQQSRIKSELNIVQKLNQQKRNPANSISLSPADSLFNIKELEHRLESIEEQRNFKKKCRLSINKINK